MFSQDAYLPVAGEDLQNLNNTAEHIRRVLCDLLGREIGYCGEAVKMLSDGVNGLKLKKSQEEIDRLIWMYGAFLGKAIIESYSEGRNHWVDNKVDNYCLKVYTEDEETMAAPFTRVIRHFKEGDEHSMYAFFLRIGYVVENGMVNTANKANK